MKKVIAAFLTFVLTLLALSSCNNAAGVNLPGKTDGGETTLEFWIGDNVNDYDWSGYDEIYGWMGAREFLGKGYSKYYDEDSQVDRKPEYYVSYLVTNYPDYSSKDSCITRIDVTDPAVKVYGLTTESSLEDFERTFSALGYEISDVGSTGKVKKAEKDGVWFSFNIKFDDDNPASISIQAEVTNIYGIQY